MNLCCNIKIDFVQAINFQLDSLMVTSSQLKPGKTLLTMTILLLHSCLAMKCKKFDFKLKVAAGCCNQSLPSCVW